MPATSGLQHFGKNVPRQTDPTFRAGGVRDPSSATPESKHGRWVDYLGSCGHRTQPTGRKQTLQQHHFCGTWCPA